MLVVSALAAVLLARIGHTPQPRLLAAWPRELPLPPAALGAGLLGALAFGDEFRHPALAADRGTVPRRLGLLAAKLLVAAATALLLAFLTVGCDAEVLYLVYGRELAQVPADWLSLSASWLGLVVGLRLGRCAGRRRLPVHHGRARRGARRTDPRRTPRTKGLGGPVCADRRPGFRGGCGVVPAAVALRGERYLSAAVRVIAQPVGGALTLSLTALLCAYLLTTLRSRVR